MSTQQQSLVSVTIDGAPLGVFDTLSGGDVSAEPAKHRSGGMGTQKAYAALGDTDDVTVSRVYERERDHDLLRRLRPRVGRGVATITDQPLDDDGARWGKPTVYIGRLSKIAPGEVDSESGDPRMYELTVLVTEAK